MSRLVDLTTKARPIAFFVLIACLVLGAFSAPVLSQLTLDDLVIRAFDIAVSIRPVEVSYGVSGGERYFSRRGSLHGITNAMLEVHSPNPVTTARFSLHRDLKLLSVRAAGYQITSNRQWDTLTLMFSPALQPGTRIPLIFDYEGDPLYIYDEFVLVWEGTLYPVLVSPFGDYSVNLARITLRLNAPPGYTVVAPGKLVSRNGSTFIWDSEVPVPWVAVAGGRKHTAHDKTIQGLAMHFYAAQGEDRNLDKLAEFAGKSVEFYSKLLYPFPYSEFRVVSLGIIGGGLGYPALLLIDERAFRNTFDHDLNRDSYLFKLIAHEAAHSYVPSQTVPKGVGFIWLSEGFAEYLALMALETVQGTEAFNRELQGERDAYAKIAGTPVEPPIGAVSFANYRGAGPVIYNKGSLVLHMLRGVLGDEVFRRGLATYFSTFRGQAARLTDFQQVMEHVSGQSLDWFFRQWIIEKVLPDYTITRTGSSKTVVGTFQTTATVQNLGTGRMPVEVGFIMNGEVQIERVEVPSGGEATVTATTHKAVKQIEVDPRGWLIQRHYRRMIAVP